ERDAPSIALLRHAAHFAHAVHVALHHVTSDALIEPQRALEIHRIALAPRAERGAAQGLGHGIDREAAGLDRDGREAASAHRDAVAHASVLEHALCRDPEPARSAARALLDAGHPAHLLDDAAEHV